MNQNRIAERSGTYFDDLRVLELGLSSLQLWAALVLVTEEGSHGLFGCIFVFDGALFALSFLLGSGLLGFYIKSWSFCSADNKEGFKGILLERTLLFLRSFSLKSSVSGIHRGEREKFRRQGQIKALRHLPFTDFLVTLAVAASSLALALVLRLASFLAGASTFSFLSLGAISSLIFFVKGKF